MNLKLQAKISKASRNDFGAVLRRRQQNAHPYHVEVMDDVYVKANEHVAFEFLDADASHNRSYRYRRIYNLVLGWDMIGYKALVQARDDLDYVIVKPSAESGADILATNPTLSMAMSLDALVEEAPWEYDPWECVRNKVRLPSELHLSGHICRMAYIVYEHQLDAFIRWKGL